MKKLFSKLSVAMVLFISLMSAINVDALEDGCNCRNCECETAEGLKEKERILWDEHIFWTRNYIISKLEGLKDKDKVLERLIKNQEDIGNSFMQYYDEEVGENITKLLKQHILIADNVVEAAKGGNKEELKKYDDQWHSNADEIVDYLYKINSNYDKKVLKDLFYTHLALLTDQVIARIGNSYDDEISAFDQGEEHIIMLADTISSGIAKQFYDKLK